MKAIRILFLFVIFISCDKNEESVDLDKVKIRIVNASAQIFQSVYVSSGRGENTYLEISPGESSNYKPYEEAYEYGYIKVTVSGSEYVIQPFDYVGETVLKPGKYSYILGIVDNNLTLKFTED